MIRSYINIAFRNLSRYKSFAIINIIGLAIGLAASLIIALWVFDELSYDKFHENSNNIYRVERHIHWDGEIMDVPVTGAIYAETIKKDIPEVLDYTRIDPTELSVINYKNSGQEEQFLFVDKGFFNVFSFPLLRGNPETALAEPYCVVMTRKAALAYFGEEFPIDKSLEVEWGDEKKMFRVTGILDDIPSQNHFQFEILGSFITFEEHDPEHLDTWVSNYLYSYVLLHPETDPESLDPKLRNIVEEHIAPAYEAFLGGTGEEMDIHEIFQIRLRPLESIHLNSDLLWEIEPQGNITTVYIFSVISFSFSFP